MKISLRRRHALMVAVGAFSHKIDYVAIFSETLNPEEHLNRITSSTVTAILLYNTFFIYIALQGTTKVPLPHIKVGETLNLRLFGVCLHQK